MDSWPFMRNRTPRNDRAPMLSSGEREGLEFATDVGISRPAHVLAPPMYLRWRGRCFDRSECFQDPIGMFCVCRNEPTVAAQGAGVCTQKV